MDVLLKIFGEGKDLSVVQMSCRSIVVFILALVMIRIAGRRAFGLKRPLDNIIVILLGSILSRAVAGASPFVPTMAACLVFVILHRVCAMISIRNKHFSRFINGEKMPVYRNGAFDYENMRRALVHEEDVLEQIRLRANEDKLEKIDVAYMEKNGEISSVKKQQ